MKGDCIALYLRLSQEDVLSHGSALVDESNSIQNQRLILRGYIEKHPEFAEFQVMEFVDDGYSGTNFERPDFQKMLKLVRDGMIKCIIVKDLSRFGRNYLEVGDYLEHIFPFLGVRFISVNDHYDSNAYIGSTGGLDITLRNFLYQQYSYDLSEKVKSAKHTLMEKGKHITNCPYGYMKKNGIKDKMFIDPVTAPIVKEIFLCVIDGMKTTEIAAMLNERNILTPMQYKKLKRKDNHNDSMWSHQAILRIIKEFKYTGAMVSFRCENATVRAKVQRRKPREEWVITENCHEPIVSLEEYQMANSMILKVKSSKRIKSDCKDRIFYCGHCGRRLRKTYGTDEYYSCTTSMYRKGSKCCNIYWSRSDIESIILAAYENQLLLMKEEHQKSTGKEFNDSLEECRAHQRAVIKELSSLDASNLQLYEKYREGIFDLETFTLKKTGVIKQKEILQQKMDDLRIEEDRILSEQNDYSIRLKHLESAEKKLSFSIEELKTDMYDSINRVTVFSSKEIEINWKFDIELNKVCNG